MTEFFPSSRNVLRRGEWITRELKGRMMTKDEAWKIIGVCERWNKSQASISDDPEIRKAENDIYNARRAALAQAWRVIGEMEGE
jgi:hypothetical protein